MINQPLAKKFELVGYNACGFIFYNTDNSQEISTEYYSKPKQVR
jgi:hypothetical protein